MIKKIIAIISLWLLPSISYATDIIKKDTTSKLLEIFVSDSSSTIGGGLTGLVYNSAGLSCYYYRSGAGTATAITLATMTLGTWATGGFVVVDGTNAPGWYQIGLPNAMIATGASSVSLHCKGATNMVPLPIAVQLVSYDPDVAWSTLTAANIQTEAEDALIAHNLDHLVGTATGIPAIVAGTYIDQMMDDGTATYDRTTDSLQVIRDNLGGSAPTAAQIADAVWDEAKADHTTATTFGDLATDLDTVAVDVAGLDGAAMRGTDSAYTGTPPTAATIADAVWDEAATGHTDAGKAGEQLWTDVDAILTDTGTSGVLISDGTGTGQLDTSSGKVSLTPIATGTENGAASATVIYWTGAINQRTRVGMCLEATVGSNAERSKITGAGTGYNRVKGFSTTPTDASTINIWPDGCD